MGKEKTSILSEKHKIFGIKSILQASEIIFNLGEIASEIIVNITHRQNTIQYIQYFPQIHLQINIPKYDFTQCFSLAFLIQKNTLSLYSFSEEKEAQNGLLHHSSFKLLVVNQSNTLHRKVDYNWALTVFYSLIYNYKYNTR